MRLNNILWNLMGLGLPLLMAALIVPKLLGLIGGERFGLLALAWGLVGYASALDLGIGRATTQRIARLRGSSDHEVPDVVATAIKITLITGGIGMLVILLAAVGGAYRLIHTNSVPSLEIEISMILLALALPMQAISATYRGVNEAYLNFKNISLLRIFLGITNFGAPFLISLYTKEVHWLVSTLVFSRFIALVCYRRFAQKCMIENGHGTLGKFSKSVAYSLAHFGGWVTASNIISPLLVQADRFLIGALISASAVTLYVIPYELTVQMLIFAGAITSVAFPVIANQIHISPQRAQKTFRLWLYRIAILMLVTLAGLAYFMPALLKLWIGENISNTSIDVGRCLCIGVFFNAIGSMYFSLLHARGKAKATALLHLFELPAFFVVLYTLIINYGPVGAAVAWSLRMFVDATALIIITKRSRINNNIYVSQALAL